MILPITILAATATAYILYNLSSFLRHSKICYLTIETDAEKILFVSDLHISTNLENNRELNVIGEFMRKNNFTLLFILGDLFDDFHTRASSDGIEKKMKKGKKTKKKKNKNKKKKKTKKKKRKKETQEQKQ